MSSQTEVTVSLDGGNVVVRTKEPMRAFVKVGGEAEPVTG
jgi:hypothetical protein